MDKLPVLEGGTTYTLFFSNRNDHQYKFVDRHHKFFEFHILHYLKVVHQFSGWETFYDIGSCFGNHALFFHKELEGRVYAFEPNADSLEVICKAVAANQADIKAFNVAAGEENYKASLLVDLKNAGATKVVTGEQGSIDVITIDGFIKQEDMIPPDFLKIDVEGFEDRVLQGAVNTLKTHSPDILIEMLDSQKAQMSEDFLEKLGYRKLARFGKTYHFSKSASVLKRAWCAILCVWFRAEKEIIKAKTAL